jgi:predicted DNA-binding transcriptional regulator YafY
MSYNESKEEKRERLLALFFNLVQAGDEKKGLTRETIVKDLKVDDAAALRKGKTRKKLAYDGDETATRQKFERDKADIRDLGITISTRKGLNDIEEYWIDKDSVFAPSINFTPEEQRVVDSAYALLGITHKGIERIFDKGKTPSGSLQATVSVQVLFQALNKKLKVKLTYRTTTAKKYVFAPLYIFVDAGNLYVVGWDEDNDRVLGFRINRIEGYPEIIGPVTVTPEMRKAAMVWVPNFEEKPQPVNAEFSISSLHREIVARKFPDAVFSDKDGDLLEVVIPFQGLTTGRQSIVSLGRYVRGLHAGELKKEVVKWLKGVNQNSDLVAHDFSFDETSGRASSFAEGLQLVASVYASDEPVLASTLARIHNLEIDEVKTILSRLISMAYIGEKGDYLVSVGIADDLESDPDPADPSYEFQGTHNVLNYSSVTWADIFDLDIALKEAAWTQPSELLSRVIAKVDEAVQGKISVVQERPEFLDTVSEMKNRDMTMEYWTDNTEKSKIRKVVPGDIRIRKGNFYFRGYDLDATRWKTWRVDRIVDVTVKGSFKDVTAVDEQSETWVEMNFATIPVVIAIKSEIRWLFESLPRVSWKKVDNMGFVIQIFVSDGEFLDRLMVEAGPYASVLTPEYRTAGRELAKRILKTL